MRNFVKKQNGITLIALVVTIIVLIILAGVSIAMLVGDNGIITQAQRAKNETEQAALEEQQGLNSLMSEFTNIMAEEPTPPEPEIPYIDDSIVVAPQISSGMTPVKYDENQSKWVKTDNTDSEWYNYGNKEWANVVLVGENGKDADGDQDVFNSDGTLNEDSNYSMLVWIPRYAYKINSQYHQSGTGAGEIDIIFIGTDNKGKDGSKTYSTTYPSVSDGAMSDYVVHPAFDYGETTLPGFWVGKFESSNTAGYGNSSDTADTTDLTMQIKAGVASWRNIAIGNIFTVCTNMNSDQNPYGLNTSDTVVDPHLMKNSEWGAVAYLSQNTTYGKGEEVWINNNTSFITGRAGDSVSETSSTTTGEYSYNTTNGQNASTTGNITGVYDMNGGAWEYVTGYVDNENSSLTRYGSVLVSADSKYKDVYSPGSSDSPENNYAVSTPENSHYGDAIYETSSSYSDTNGWYSDHSYFSYSSWPFFIRGGINIGETDAGVFAFSYSSGNYYNDMSFRVIVPVL